MLIASVVLIASFATSPPLHNGPRDLLLQNPEDLRIARLSAIAEKIQEPESDGVALLTEAARLCGFVIWKEDRSVVAEPTGSPRLKLALTDSEIKEYVLMFREGHSVALMDLIGAVDVLYKGIGATESCEPHVRDWIANGPNGANPSTRALNLFLKDLGAYRDGGDGDLFDSDPKLDPLQALLLIRVLTEEIGVPLRRAIAHPSGLEIWMSIAPAPRPAEAAGWAEDAFVGGITGLYGAASEVCSKIKSAAGGHAEVTGKANALASIAKFIATYTFLKGETSVEDPGQPLVRTKDTYPGEKRTLVAKFTIDGTRVTDWMKENRPLVALAGLDLDMPKTGALKGVETEWDIKESRSSSKSHLIRLVGPNPPDISKIKTDENGEAKIRVEGMPRSKKLDPKTVMPDDNKVVRIVITPQVKATEMQQDIVDAILGAIGVAGVAKGDLSGLLGPIMETLYRLKWKGAKVLNLRIQDWIDAETVGQLEVDISAHGSAVDPKHSFQQTLDRHFRVQDAVMMVMGGEMPELLDPEMLKNMPPTVRQQMEEGLKQMREAAQRRSFMLQGPGHGSLRINDRSAWFSLGSVTTGCESDPPGSGSSSVVGSKEEEIEPVLMDTGDEKVNLPANGWNFSVEVDLAKKTATLTWGSEVDVVMTTNYKLVGNPPVREEKKRKLGLFYDIKIQAPYDKEIVIPLKETDLRGSNAKNYYGTVSIPFKFGPQDKFEGKIQAAYSVTRKVSKTGG